MRVSKIDFSRNEYFYYYRMGKNIATLSSKPTKFVPAKPKKVSQVPAYQKLPRHKINPHMYDVSLLKSQTITTDVSKITKFKSGELELFVVVLRKSGINYLCYEHKYDKTTKKHEFKAVFDSSKISLATTEFLLVPFEPSTNIERRYNNEVGCFNEENCKYAEIVVNGRRSIIDVSYITGKAICGHETTVDEEQNFKKGNFRMVLFSTIDYLKAHHDFPSDSIGGILMF